MATIIGGGPRKPPRIMARKNIVFKRVPKNGRDDEGEKIKREGFEVQSGVLKVSQNHPSNFQPKTLPGIANEVESFPCRLCERVFLTSKGLELHGKQSHAEHMDEILQDIATITGEWKKREFEKIRSRERHSMEKLRHEARAHQLVRAAMNGGTSSDGCSTSGTSGDQYEACTSCNMLVNIAHPTAMENHQKAHKKNDDLRFQMIDQFGHEAVARLTCEACSLVFPDDQKLTNHINSQHMRRKKYICKFCGHISQSMSELNLHKADVHNYKLHNACYNVPSFLKSRRTFFQYDEDLKRMRRRTAEEMAEDVAVRQPILGEISEGDNAGRVTCPECGLKLNRPRLLFKHMERVHMKTSFSFMLESGGLPTFGIDVQNSEITYMCCDGRFDNRADFIEHRRLHIPTQHEEIVGTSEEVIHHHHHHRAIHLPQLPAQAIVAVEDGGVDESGEPTTHQIPADFVQNDDGTVQVIVPEGIEISGDVFLLFEDPEGGGSITSKVQLIPQHHLMPQDGSDQHHQMDGRHLIVEHVDTDPQMIEEEEIMNGMAADEEGAEDEDQAFDQYQHLHIGNEWDNMDMILVNEDEVLEEEAVDQAHHLQLIDDDDQGVDDEDDGGVVRINGQPLFD